MRILLAIALSALAHAQIGSPSVTPGTTQIVNPANFLAVGVGGAQGIKQVNGWISFGTKIKDSTYSYTTTEYTSANSTLRTGVAQVLLRNNGITLMLIGDGGISTGGTSNLAGSFSFGGIAAFDLSRFNLHNTHLVFAARPIKTNAAATSGGGFHTAFQFGIGRTF